MNYLICIFILATFVGNALAFEVSNSWQTEVDIGALKLNVESPIRIKRGTSECIYCPYDMNKAYCLNPRTEHVAYNNRNTDVILGTLTISGVYEHEQIPGLNYSINGYSGLSFTTGAGTTVDFLFVKKNGNTWYPENPHSENPKEMLKCISDADSIGLDTKTQLLNINIETQILHMIEYQQTPTAVEQLIDI